MGWIPRKKKFLLTFHPKHLPKIYGVFNLEKMETEIIKI